MHLRQCQPSFQALQVLRLSYRGCHTIRRRVTLIYACSRQGSRLCYGVDADNLIAC